MKAGKIFAALILAGSCAFTGMLAWPGSIHAAKLDSTQAVRKIALAKVPNGIITEIDQDYENGVFVYEVEMVKGAKKYEFTYRASDAKMLKYSWEKTSVGKNSDKPVISRSKCKALAKKQVKNGTILSLAQKTDDGIDIYKVKMKAGSKQYTLKYHARTGALIDYEWKIEQTSQASDSTNGYIGLSKAKQIALADVSGGTVVKAKLDTDDGVPVYEVEVVKGNYEYEYKIHAKTGAVLEKDKDWND